MPEAIHPRQPTRPWGWRLPRALCAWMGALALGIAAAANAELAPGQVTEQLVLSWEGTARYYDVFVPSVYDGVQPLPLVVDLHGYASSASRQREISGIEALAQSEGFVAVWPTGSGFASSWNAGPCCGEAALRNTDDVGFILAMVEALEDQLRIDPARIYVTGLSNGGGLAHRLACESAHVFAAAAPIAFPLPHKDPSTCQPSRPIPIAMAMGLTDTVVSYTPAVFHEPEPLKGEGTFLTGAQESLAAWRDKNGCQGSAPDKVTPLRQPAICETYSVCEGGVQTRLCSLVGEHEGAHALRRGHVLYFNQSGFDVARNSWNFMNRFSLSQPAVDTADSQPESCSSKAPEGAYAWLSCRFQEALRYLDEML